MSSTHSIRNFPFSPGSSRRLTSDARPRREPTRARKSRSVAGAEPARGAERVSLYLGGFGRHPLLTREGEIELARRIEEGERVLLRTLAESPLALRELAAVGEDIQAKRLRARDALRNTNDDELADGRAERRLLAVLRRAGAVATELESGAPGESRKRRSLLDALERTRLHRRILDRVMRALHEADEETRASLEAIEESLKTVDDAKATFVESNLRLVVAFAKRHLNRGLQLHDLIQEGTIGLMRAVDKFDHRRGHRFSTYAAWWVDQQMARAIADQARTIRVPVHLGESRAKVHRVRRQFVQEHGRAPTEEEVLEKSGLSREKVRAVDGIALDPLSLDAPLGPDQTADLGDVIPDRTTPAPDEQSAHARMRQQTKALLDTLSPREQDILRRRFGLDDAPENTLEEIGTSLSLSRERIRQIETAALHKLRAHSGSKGLETYLGG